MGVFDLFKIGIGPSSSHTVGPMKAAASFVRGLSKGREASIARIEARVFGSLAWTGKGHATDRALTLGLSGKTPDGIDPDEACRMFKQISGARQIALPSGRRISFEPETDIVFDTRRQFSRHPNAMEFTALDESGNVISSEIWFSIGGGFIERLDAENQENGLKYPLGFEFRSSHDLLDLCRLHSCTIADIAMANEIARRGEEETVQELDHIIDVMMKCIDRGLRQDGELPGGLRVRRRAGALFEKLQNITQSNSRSISRPFDHISVFAIAVNEENAAGGRVVTAPTNGAAGVVPAVLRYYRDLCDDASLEGSRTFLLVASAIGSIIKRNASISGAEVGCQGEVGSAAAMASAGITAALGGTNEQVENAAEIAIEHHLGMTCDPVGGLVQIPCIERNAFGAVKAVNAAYLALAGDGKHRVSLDQVIETMRQTGADMHDKYRETSRGGLAVNVPEC
ncbi:L-serine ammonia-lyase [Bradyrhizobium zhanjiangense]|uniref:L-serine dehydratase n=1 Tax=Bradyrhizobium zhanjiangense TaxID=1325107 RepID=A0A4Q0Q6G3_9BRAD|nr:L-serine ammonia-lyase [Bradyrhizobium zhanjiangense]RXG83858.1 L-serine ammonia-lyase [Bradyrhizobium zhanjiangense]